MQRFLFLFTASVVFMMGCTDRPEVSPNVYGTILEELPAFKEAKEPFPFPQEGDNDHQHCEFNEMDFM
jgi:hypothetical protein